MRLSLLRHGADRMGDVVGEYIRFSRTRHLVALFEYAILPNLLYLGVVPTFGFPDRFSPRKIIGKKKKNSFSQGGMNRLSILSII